MMVDNRRWAMVGLIALAALSLLYITTRTPVTAPEPRDRDAGEPAPAGSQDPPIRARSQALSGARVSPRPFAAAPETRLAESREEPDASYRSTMFDAICEEGGLDLREVAATLATQAARKAFVDGAEPFIDPLTRARTERNAVVERVAPLLWAAGKGETIQTAVGERVKIPQREFEDQCIWTQAAADDDGRVETKRVRFVPGMSAEFDAADNKVNDQRGETRAAIRRLYFDCAQLGK
jgi:hypothetical protein